MRPPIRLLSLILFCVVARPVFAIPAPMSEAELVEKSDLVALVRVLSVTCTSLTKDEQTGEELPGYLATATKILEVKKGDVKPGDEVLVTWREIPTGVLGPWVVRYYPGEEVWTHLEQAERRRDLRHHLVERQRPADQARADHRAADQGRRDRHHSETAGAVTRLTA